jgi:hypothetical protein
MPRRTRRRRKLKGAKRSVKGCAGVKRNGQLKKGYRWRKGVSGACPIKVRK